MRRSLAIALLPMVLAACAHAPAAGPAVPAAVRLPPPKPMMLCLDCGRISSLLPGDIPRWRYTVQMDNGTEEIVFQDKTPALTIGARVRVVKGRIELR